MAATPTRPLPAGPVIAVWLPGWGGAPGVMRHYHRSCLTWTARVLGTRFTEALLCEPLRCDACGRALPLARPPDGREPA